MTREILIKEYQDAIDTFCKKLDWIDNEYGTYVELECDSIPSLRLHGDEDPATCWQYRRIAIGHIKLDQEFRKERDPVFHDR